MNLGQKLQLAQDGGGIKAKNCSWPKTEEEFKPKTAVFPRQRRNLSQRLQLAQDRRNLSQRLQLAQDGGGIQAKNCSWPKTEEE